METALGRTRAEPPACTAAPRRSRRGAQIVADLGALTDTASAACCWWWRLERGAANCRCGSTRHPRPLIGGGVIIELRRDRRQVCQLCLSRAAGPAQRLAP